MKNTFEFNFSGFDFKSLRTPKVIGPNPVEVHTADEDINAKIDAIVLKVCLEYTPEELIETLKNQSTFIAGLPALIDSCVMAFRVAMSNPIKPPTETE